MQANTIPQTDMFENSETAWNNKLEYHVNTHTLDLHEKTRTHTQLKWKPKALLDSHFPPFFFLKCHYLQTLWANKWPSQILQHDKNEENKRQCHQSVLFWVAGWVWCWLLLGKACGWYMEWVEITGVGLLIGLLKCHCELCMSPSLKRTVWWLSIICRHHCLILAEGQIWLKQQHDS